MDRFIAAKYDRSNIESGNLKSNMDRFIALPAVEIQPYKPNLKSNMDRFIVGRPTCKTLLNRI